MPPRIAQPNVHGRYRCSDFICAVRRDLQLVDIWNKTKALFPVNRQLICVGSLPWNEATGRMACVFKIDDCANF